MKVEATYGLYPSRHPNIVFISRRMGIHGLDQIQDPTKSRIHGLDQATPELINKNVLKIKQGHVGRFAVASRITRDDI